MAAGKNLASALNWSYLGVLPHTGATPDQSDLQTLLDLFALPLWVGEGGAPVVLPGNIVTSIIGDVIQDAF